MFSLLNVSSNSLKLYGVEVRIKRFTYISLNRRHCQLQDQETENTANKIMTQCIFIT